MTHRLIKAYDFVVEKVLNRLQSPLLFVLRAWWGWSFFVAGRNKLQGIEGIIDYFTTLGIPMPAFNAYFASTVECVGGLLLLLGLFARPAAFFLTCTMTVAYITAEREKVLHVFQDPDKFIAADPFHFLLVALLVLAFGPGWFSLDTIVRSLVTRKGASAPAAPLPGDTAVAER